MNEFEDAIRNNPDASVWAKAFIEQKEKNGWSIEDIDFGLMIGWFANYWAAVHDPLSKKIEALEKQGE